MKLEIAGRLTPTKRKILNMPAEGESDWPQFNARGQLRGTGQVDGSAQR